MPKVPAYTLAWSSTIQVYELSTSRDQVVLRIIPESPEWFAWISWGQENKEKM